MSGKKEKEARKMDRAALALAFDEHFQRVLALSQDMGVHIPAETPNQFWSLPILEKFHERIKNLEALIGSDNKH